MRWIMKAAVASSNAISPCLRLIRPGPSQDRGEGDRQRERRQRRQMTLAQAAGERPAQRGARGGDARFFAV